MVTFFTVIQIIFAEKVVSQDFTIRAAPGLSGPTNTCGTDLTGLDLTVHSLPDFSLSPVPQCNKPKT